MGQQSLVLPKGVEQGIMEAGFYLYHSDYCIQCSRKYFCREKPSLGCFPERVKRNWQWGAAGRISELGLMEPCRSLHYYSRFLLRERKISQGAF